MKRVALVLLCLILLTTVSCMTQEPVSNEESSVPSTTTTGTQSASMTTVSTQTTAATATKPESVVTTTTTSRPKSTTGTTKTALKPRTTTKTKAPATTATTKSTTPPTSPTEAVKPKETTLDEAYDYYTYSIYNAYYSEKYCETISQQYNTTNNKISCGFKTKVNIYNEQYQIENLFEQKLNNDFFNVFLYFSGETVFYREDDLENGSYSIAFPSTPTQFKNDNLNWGSGEAIVDFAMSDVETFTITEPKENLTVINFKIKHRAMSQQVLEQVHYITEDTKALLNNSTSDYYRVEVAIDKRNHKLTSLSKQYSYGCVVNSRTDIFTCNVTMDMKELTTFPSMSYVPDWATKEISPRPDWVG